MLGLIALALVLDFLFFTGFYASDDVSYLETARSIAEHHYLKPELGNARLGVTLPSAFVWWISDGSIAAVVWFHVAYHLALVVIAYVLGRLLLDDRAGLIAAALVAINPLLYVYAGAVLPDNAATFWFGGAMIALVVTARYADPGTHLTSWNRRRFLGYFVAGAMVGFCYWCKETALILTVPAAITIMRAGPSLRSLVWIQNGASFTLGLVVVIVIEALLLRGLSGEWVNRLSFLSEAEGVLDGVMQQQGTTPFARFAFASGQVKSWMPWSMWLLIAGAVAYGFTRVRDVGMMTFFWWPALYLTIGSTSLTGYFPPPIQGRYYAIVILPAAVMCAVAASHVVQRWLDREREGWWHRNGPRLVVALVLAIVGVRELAKNLDRSGRIYRASEARAFVAARELARDRYGQYPVQVSAFYRRRMTPLVHDIPPGAPGKPYIYIEQITEANRRKPDPSFDAQRLRDVPPPRSRSAVVGDAFLRMFGMGKKPRIDSERERDSGAAVLLITPRDGGVSPRKK